MVEGPLGDTTDMLVLDREGRDTLDRELSRQERSLAMLLQALRHERRAAELELRDRDDIPRRGLGGRLQLLAVRQLKRADALLLAAGCLGFALTDDHFWSRMGTLTDQRALDTDLAALSRREIWVAAKSGGFHFRPDAGRWIDSRDGVEFFEALSRHAGEQAGRPLQFSPA